METLYVWKYAYMPTCVCFFLQTRCVWICAYMLTHDHAWKQHIVTLLMTACVWICIFRLIRSCIQSLHLCEHEHICQQVTVFGTWTCEHKQMFWHKTELSICTYKFNTYLCASICPCLGSCIHVNMCTWVNTCPCSGTLHMCQHMTMLLTCTPMDKCILAVTIDWPWSELACVWVCACEKTWSYKEFSHMWESTYAPTYD